MCRGHRIWLSKSARRARGSATRPSSAVCMNGSAYPSIGLWIPSWMSVASTGSKASDPDAPVQNAVRALKREVPGLIVVTDVCLCEYTSHGHCGILEGEEILNDVTVAHVADAALSHAVAGADIVAPSDMMDGRVAAIRTLLDERGLDRVGIMSYAAKYCSAFYGPFRDAADSTPQFGDRR